MTRIKCKYNAPHCEHPFAENYKQNHNEYWSCDSNDGCEIGKYTKPSDEIDKPFPTCVWCKYYNGEFERTVDDYSYEYGVLVINDEEVYTDWDIEYLEIDGRVLVGGGE